MNKRAIKVLILLILFIIPTRLSAKFEARYNDFLFKFSGLFKPEMFTGVNISLLNKNNIGNKVWYERHTLDLNLGIECGQETYGFPVVDSYFTIRNRGLWGNPESIARTTEAEFKDTDAVIGKHKHAIPRHIFWMRQGWLQFDLNESFRLSFLNTHSFKLGFFPFELGRGIALGEAYAVGPEILGFYTDSAVDQFAPGGLLRGEILEKTLSYDLYTAILQNRSTSLAETGAEILGQEFGRRETPQRGSGKINFLIAGRLNWEVFNHEKYGYLHLEPYAFYNRDPEQKIEFRGDASSQLGTIGLAMEYEHPIFEAGFDYAFNLGQQRVKGWDRNTVNKQNRDGRIIIVNSHVVDQDGKKVPFVSDSTAQEIIECAPQDESQNDQVIGTVDSVGFLTGPVTLRNSNNRFRNSYTNTYEGWMFVMDAGIWAYKKDLFLAATAGITTGDRNPNEERMDRTYSGFISLQEIYYGKRVKSAFFGKFDRPLSEPASNQSPSRFARKVDNFNNLVFCGFSLKYEPQEVKRPLKFQPNALAYWQEHPTKKFDAQTGKELDCLASTFLGVELNIFSHIMLVKDLKLFAIGSVFFPGAHFRDIKGKPLNAAQKKQLDRLDRTGFSAERIPNLGDDTAYTLNIGLEFKF